MDLRLSDVGYDGVRVVHLEGDGVCVYVEGKSARAAPCGSERADANSPPRGGAESAFAPVLGSRSPRPSLNSANLLPTLVDLRSIASTPSTYHPRLDLTLAPSRRSKLTRNDFDRAATRLLAAHQQQQQLDRTSLEHASLEQRRYPLATGWEWHVGPGSNVCVSVLTCVVPSLTSFFHPPVDSRNRSLATTRLWRQALATAQGSVHCRAGRLASAA